MASESAFKKLNAALSARDHHTRAVDGAPILPGLIRSEMTPTTEVEAAATSGKSRRTTTSIKIGSIASAFERPREAHSVKERAAHAPVGVITRLGPAISVMTPITEVEAVVMLGDWNPNGHLTAQSHCAECASKKQKGAPSARATAKAAVDGAGAHTKMASGPCRFAMIQITAVEAVLITGIWIASHQL